MRVYEDNSAITSMQIWGLTNLLFVPIEQFGALPLNRLVLIAAHAAAILSLVIFLVLKRLAPQAVSAGVGILMLITAIPFAWMPVRVADAGMFQELVAPMTMFSTQSMLVVIACPTRTRDAFLQAACLFGIFCGLARPYAAFFADAELLFAAVLVVGIITNHMIREIMRQIAKTEARAEIDLLPPGLAASTGDRRAKRYVVLTSDWRGYQERTRRATPEVIGSILSKYYELCAALLERHSIGVPHASDWIADELIVYFPAHDETQERAAAAAAMAFARQLLRDKDDLVFPDGRPPSIDIGIVSNMAILDLFGAHGRQKLVAVGPALCEARRLQTHGKKLRARFGARDRLVCDARVAALAGGGNLQADDVLFFEEAA